MSNEISPYHIARVGPPPNPQFLHEPSLFSGEVNFKEYWRVVRNHRLMIFALIFACVVGVLAWRFARTPQYEATSTLLIQPQTPQVLSETKDFNLNRFNTSSDYDYYRTQFDLLKSDSLAARVIRDYGLEAEPLFSSAAQHPGLLASVIAYVRNEVASLAGSDDNAASSVMGPEGVNPEVIRAYLARLTIEPVRGTQL